MASDARTAVDADRTVGESRGLRVRASGTEGDQLTMVVNNTMPEPHCPVVVVVRREGRCWFAEAPPIQVVRTRSLHSAVRSARQLLGEDVPVHYQFHTGDMELDRLVLQIQTARAEAERLEARLRQLMSKVFTLPSGGSVRDVGLLVGLSYQRVHQLMLKQRADSRPPEGDLP